MLFRSKRRTENECLIGGDVADQSIEEWTGHSVRKQERMSQEDEKGADKMSGMVTTGHVGRLKERRVQRK